MQHTDMTQVINIKAPPIKGWNDILQEDALEFLFQLQSKFNTKRLELLEKRKVVQTEIDRGILPGFLPETASIRNDATWKVNPVPSDLQDRRVEITGPVDRKMIINALNSGASTFMADFEDSNTPSWSNLIEGQINLRDAVNGSISFINEQNGKVYALSEKTATLLVRPRGWHMDEKHVMIDGQSMSASLFDFGLYVYNNTQTLINKGSGPYFYLPKIEHYLEARLWNEVFDFTEEYLELTPGTIKATVLIETILAAFQMNEILYELRTHSAGLNCGRWDYIFSFIKKFKNVQGYVFPDRSQVTMTVPFMRAYSQLVIQTCHKRGIHAIGGMAAQIPIKNDEAANNAAIEKVQADKLREVKDGHDGTWVAHPGLVSVAKNVFDEYMPQPNQIDNLREDFSTSADTLIQVPQGTITEAGLRQNINVGILYIESWLSGNGAAALYNMMEDAATAEISRTQVWQWLKAGVTPDNGITLTHNYIQQLIVEETEKIKILKGIDSFNKGKFKEAILLFETLVFSEECPEFLTTIAYELID